MGVELQFIHHVGHVVRDMDAALRLYRRLGFDFSPPAYPTMSRAESEPPRPFGAANTHMSFARNFIEVATVVPPDHAVPSGAKLVPLQAAPAAREAILERIKLTVAELAESLRRFEGLHILVFGTADMATSQAQLDRAGVRHGEVTIVQRPLDTTRGLQIAPVKYLEIGGERLPEGRLAVAENPPLDIRSAQTHLDHPNGAVDLLESVLCVPDAELGAYGARYSRYFGRDVEIDGGALRFDMGGGGVTLVPASALSDILPGEATPVLPAFVAYAVRVRSVSETRALLEANGLPTVNSSNPGIFVPARAALGAAVIFRA